MGTFRDDELALAKRVEAKRVALEDLRIAIVERDRRAAEEESSLDQELAKRELKEKFRGSGKYIWLALGIMAGVMGYSMITKGLFAGMEHLGYAALIGFSAFQYLRATQRARGQTTQTELSLAARSSFPLEGATREQLQAELADLEQAEAALLEREAKARDARSTRVSTIEEKLARDMLSVPADQDAVEAIKKRQRRAKWISVLLAGFGVGLFAFRFFMSGVVSPIGPMLIVLAVLLGFQLKRATQKQIDQVEERREIRARVEIAGEADNAEHEVEEELPLDAPLTLEEAT